MANIDSLKRSITEMSHDEAIQVVLTRREARREAMRQSKNKRTRSRKRKKVKTTKKSAIASVSDLSQSEAQKLLERLKQMEE